MDKLQREKRNSKKVLHMLFYDRFFNPDTISQDWEWFRKWNNKINTTKRVYPRKYTTNLDVETD